MHSMVKLYAEQLKEYKNANKLVRELPDDLDS